MTTAKPYKLDPNGFPLITCPRCDGRGNLPQYSKVFQGVCFDCDGTRLTYPTKAIAAAAKEARNRVTAAGTPSAELLADINRAAHRCRTNYDRLIVRREARAASNQPDADTLRFAAAIRDILNSGELDNVEKATAIRRLTRSTPANTPTMRSLRSGIEQIQRGWSAPTIPQHLDIIAIRIDTLTA